MIAIPSPGRPMESASLASRTEQAGTITTQQRYLHPFEPKEKDWFS
jgi:hypothetical protein